MEKATIRLNNSILGWMLVPSYQHPCPPNGAYSWLSDLYGEDYEKLKSSERAFMKGEPIEKVIAHIKDVCKGMGISVSFCGNIKGGPVIRLWRRHPLVAVKPDKIEVDLKWSCWSIDEGYWKEYAPGIFDRMLKAWKGESGPVTIVTAPRKEIRYGTVTISKGEAEGHFCAEWDSIEELADTLGTECDDAFRETIPYSSFLMEPGTDWDFSVKARSFQKLMERVDAEEDNLMEHDTREWELIKSMFEKNDVAEN